MPSNKYPNAKYTFDTSAFIQPWRDIYPEDIFEPIWKFVTKYIENEIIVAPFLVKKEIEKKYDELLKYIKRFPDLFKKPDEDEEEIIKKIINNPIFIKWAIRPHNEADPFVVALSKVHDLIVVTYESPSSPNKIPAACNLLNVKCVNFLGFLREEDFKIKDYI